MTTERAPAVGEFLLAGAAFATSLLLAVYLGAMGVNLPEIGGAFGLGTAVQGQVFPASFGGSVAGVLLSGFLSDRFGRKSVLLACIAVTVTGLMLFWLAPSFPVILLAAGLVGAGAGSAQTVSSALLSDLYPRQRAIFLNGMQVAFGVGAMLASVVAEAFLASPFSWRGFYLLLAGFEFALLVTVALKRIPVTSQREGAQMDLSTLASLLRQRHLLLLCLSIFLYAGAEVALFSWSPTYLRTLPGGDAWQGWVVTAFWLAMTFGRATLGAILHRASLGRLRFALATGGVVASSLALVAPSPVLVLAAVTLSGLCFSGIFSLLLADAGETYPQTVGTALGLLVSISGIGAGLLPWVVGALNGAGFSWPLSLSIVPLASFLFALIALPSLRKAAV